MSLEKCRECGKDVSSEAKACPHCGAVVKTTSGPFAMLGWFAGGLLAVGVVWAFVVGNEDADGRAKARSAIGACWEEQSRKSLSVSAARQIAGVCEALERDFQSQYRVKP